MVKIIIFGFQLIRLVGATFIADHHSLSTHARPGVTTTSDSKQHTNVASYPLPSTRIRNPFNQVSQSLDPLQLSPREPNDAMPIRGPRSRDPRERTTNQYGFIDTNEMSLPEKKRTKIRRETNRDINRQQRLVDKVKREYSGSTYSISLEAVEQMARGKYFRSDVNVSQQILVNFQSTKRKQALENLASELINMKTTNKKGKEIAMSELILPRDQTSLIRLLGANGCYKSMIILLRHLAVKMDISAAQYAYTAAITATAQASNQRIRVQAIRLLDEMDAKSIPPNTYTFTAVFLSVDGGKAAMELFKRAKGHKDSIEIDVHLYNSCIHACSRSPADNGKNGWQNALSLFRQQMPRDGIQPNEQTYASLLHACAKAGQLRVALSIFDEMKRNTKVPLTFNKVWGAALRACATAGNSEKAMELMEEMIQSGVRPNTLHFNSVLAALSKEGNDDIALELLEKMQAGTVEHLFQDDFISNDKAESSMPDLVSVNTVLTSFAHAGNYSGARAFFERLRAGEFTSKITDTRSIIRPDIISYNTLLSTCEDPKEAVAILEEIRMSRKKRYNAIKPTSVTYTNAIGVCKRADPPDLRSALLFLGEARKKDGVKPNIFMFSAAIWVAEACKDAKAAIFLLKTMRNNQCTPNAVAYEGVLSVLGSQGEVKAACSLLKLMKQDKVDPTAITFQKLALACQKTSSPPDSVVECLEGVLGQLSTSERKAIISGPLYNSLIRAYGRLNDFDNALRIFESIDRTNAQILSSMLFVCSAVTPVRWQDAIIILHTSDIVTGAAGRGRIEYSALSYAVIACSKENQWKEGLNLLDIYGTTKDYGKQMASVDALNSLIAAAGRSARPDIAIKILNESAKYSVTPNDRSYRSAIVACNQAEHEKRRQRRRKERLSDSSLVQVDKRHKPAFNDDDPLSLQWWEAALSLFRRMKEEGLTPDVQTYSSVISACEATGQWQRAVGILKSMTSDKTLPPNKFCFNAAIAACEKGGAWLEAVELYERMRNHVRPNFITMNSVLIALDKADQKELAENIYREALKDNIVWPWKWSLDVNGDRVRVMDLHQFSVPMGKIAVRNVIDSLSSSKPVHDCNEDLIIVVGKGRGSEDGIRMLMPKIQQLVLDEYALNCMADPNNNGRLIVKSEDLQRFSML